jgi:outer membrane protein assembly factor BamB
MGGLPGRVFALSALGTTLGGLLLLWQTGALDSRDPSSEPGPRAARAAAAPEGRPSGPNGLFTFRGDVRRAFYGRGPVPARPRVRWRYPRRGSLCSISVDKDGPGRWCGTGWTGQPSVVPRRGGGVEVRIGAYDRRYHFLDGATGRPVRPSLLTGDLAKGSATSDGDGFPLYYAGSRDNHLRVVALDRPRPAVLWSLDARTSVPRPMWNDDWDGAPLQVGDYLLEGGENSWFYVIRLHRGYDRRGKVRVRPRVVMRVPGWDQALLSAIGDTDISIENSVAFDRRRGVAYFSNSGGLVQGWDIRDVLRGGHRHRRVFRFWAGDSVDASVVLDRQGFLYVGRHREQNVPRPSSFPRITEVGSLMKLDPRRPGDPLVWSRQIGGTSPGGGILGTPALHRGVVYALATEGQLVALDQRTGRVLWRVPQPEHAWTSPVPVGDHLLVGDCQGNLRDYDISRPARRPRERWRLRLGGCVESTPAVWDGRIYVGTRGGAIYGIA